MSSLKRKEFLNKYNSKCKRIKRLEEELYNEIDKTKNNLLEYINFISNNNFDLKTRLILYENILPRCKYIFKKEEKVIFKIEHNIAQTNFELDNYDKAIEQFNILIDKTKPNTIDYSNIYVDIANCYYGLKKYNEAIDRYERIIKIYDEQYKNSENILYIKNSLAFCYVNVKEFKKGTEMMKIQLPLLIKILGDEHEETNIIKQHLEKYKDH